MKQLDSAAYDLDAEESVLGAMMASQRAVIAVLDAGLRAEHFYRPKHTLIYNAILDLDAKGQATDAISVINALRERGDLEDAGGAPLVNTLFSTVSTTGNAGRHAEIVRDNAAVRRLQLAAARIGDIAQGPGTAIDKMAEADAAMAEALEQAVAEDLGEITGELDAIKEEFRLAYEEGKPSPKLRTGFNALDDKLNGGLRPGQVLVLAARPGQGKSTLAQNIAENVAGRGDRVAIFSLEMSRAEINKRMIASQGRCPYSVLMTEKFDADSYQRMLDGHEKVSRLPINVLDASVLSMAAVRAKSRRIQRTSELALIVVDYIQLMIAAERADNRQAEVAGISRAIKQLAMELKVPIIAISQLNRGVEARENKRPTLSDLRDSGAIEQDADIVAFIYRDDAYNANSDSKGEAEIIVAKQRAGETGTVKLSFLGKYSKFSNIGSSAPATEAAFVF